MQLGMVGLGRMGANMVRRLMRDGHDCVVYDVNPRPSSGLAQEGATGADSLADFVAEARTPPRRVGHGAGRQRSRSRRSTISPSTLSRTTSSSTAVTPTTATTSHRAEALSGKGIHYVDCGTSGGVWGLERGYCLMIGGEDAVVDRLRADLRLDRARGGAAPSAPRAARASPPRGERLPALRPDRRRALREDGPQRHRVRDHGRVRRRPQHPARTPTRACTSRTPTPRRRRCETPSTTSTH